MFFSFWGKLNDKDHQDQDILDDVLQCAKPTTHLPDQRFAENLGKMVEEAYLASFVPMPSALSFSSKMKHALSDVKVFFLSAFARISISICVIVSFFSTSMFVYANPSITVRSPLYPLKTGLETVEGVTAIGTERQILYHSKIATYRFDEMKFLLAHQYPEASLALEESNRHLAKATELLALLPNETKELLADAVVAMVTNESVDLLSENMKSLVGDTSTPTLEQKDESFALAENMHNLVQQNLLQSTKRKTSPSVASDDAAPLTEKEQTLTSVANLEPTRETTSAVLPAQPQAPTATPTTFSEDVVSKVATATPFIPSSPTPTSFPTEPPTPPSQPTNTPEELPTVDIPTEVAEPTEIPAPPTTIPTTPPEATPQVESTPHHHHH
ncbi:MAG: hypothetical protein WCP97_05640 [bacterium]